MKKCLIMLVGLLSTPTFAQQGQWEQKFDFGIFNSPTVPPIAPVHLIHLHTGKIIAVDNVPPSACENNYPSGGRVYLWTPPAPGIAGSGSFVSIPNPRNSQFCTGHSALADGRILFAGSACSLART